jgi:GxxExxY protein
MDSKVKPEVAENIENALTNQVIGAAIEVHRHLGPGLLESIYEECLCYELSQMGCRIQRQAVLPISYKGLKLESAYRVDLIVEDLVVVEIKATEGTAPVHCSQLLTYLKASDKRIGLLINFNVPILKNGLKRIVNHYTGPAPRARLSAASAPVSRDGNAPEPEDEHQSLISPRLRVSASKGGPV